MPLLGRTRHAGTACPLPGGRPMLRRYTARLRLTMLDGLLTLLTGAGVLLIAGLVTVQSSTRATVPAVNHNQQPQSTASELTQARAEISHLQDQLTAQAHQANQALWHALLIGSVTALAIMAVVSVMLGWFTAHRVLRPLRRMTAATRRISADNLHARLAVPGPADEVKDLADTIDGLLERLEGAFAAQRRFVANASHELRTPLATMRASLDVAMAKPEPAPPQTTALAGRLRTELVLRIRALARRQPSARARVLKAAGLELDPLRRTVTRDGRPVDLSVKEFGVLEALLRASPAFLSAEALLEQVWDEQADPFTNTVTVTIGRLRRKLGDPPVVSTTPGVGYRIAP